MCEAAKLKESACVPLVVVITKDFPATRSGVNSCGELPKSNPSNLNPFLSPAINKLGLSRFNFIASSTPSTGFTAIAPLSNITTMLVVARRISIITTCLPTTSSANKGNS